MKTLREKKVTARKAHRCQACRTTIQPGDTYTRQTNVFDDRVYDWISCAGCSAISLDVWDWAYRPDDGIDSDSYREWAHEHAGADERADAYLRRIGEMEPAQ